MNLAQVFVETESTRPVLQFFVLCLPNSSVYGYQVFGRSDRKSAQFQPFAGDVEQRVIGDGVGVG